METNLFGRGGHIGHFGAPPSNEMEMEMKRKRIELESTHLDKMEAKDKDDIVIEEKGEREKREEVKEEEVFEKSLDGWGTTPANVGPLLPEGGKWQGITFFLGRRCFLNLPLP